MRRRFSGREKAALYLAADGRCEGCGVRLDPEWHADHMVPWARGGATDVLNGQALCAECNLSKGATVQREIGKWPEGLELRDWQDEFYQQLRRHEAADFQLEACPGSGKTLAALYVAHRFLAEGRVERVVVVCHTEPLKKQWANAAARVGLSLNPDFITKAGDEARDEHGVILTYPQVSFSPLTFARQCRRPTLGIFDEIHHVGTRLPWSRGLVEAYHGARFRLSLSGTPFRTDGREIPFTSSYYDEDGVKRSRPDYRYGYKRALKDGVCRDVLFPNYEGEVEWEAGGEVHLGRLTDECADPEEAMRLRFALEPGGPWLRGILEEANAKLTELRLGGHAVAGGLAIAREQADARVIADMLEKISGERPSLAISDEPGAHDTIDRFSRSSQRWLVAVRLVSEGVDIPRLRTGVFATNVLTELHFRQVVGRLCRHDPTLEEEQQEGYLFIPGVPTLVKYAHEVQLEREQALRELQDEVVREIEESERERREPRAEAPVFVGSSQPDLITVISDGRAWRPDQLALAEIVAREAGLIGRLRTDLLAAAIAKHFQPQAGPAGPAPTAPAAPDQQWKEKQKYRKVLNGKGGLVQRLARKLHPDGDAETIGKACMAINVRLAQDTDGQDVKRAELSALKERVRLARERLGETDGSGG